MRGTRDVTTQNVDACHLVLARPSSRALFGLLRDPIWVAKWTQPSSSKAEQVKVIKTSIQFSSLGKLYNIFTSESFVIDLILKKLVKSRIWF